MKKPPLKIMLRLNVSRKQLKQIDYTTFCRKKQVFPSNGVFTGVSGISETEILIVLGDEAVIGYVASAVHAGFEGKAVAVVIGDAVGEVNKVIEFLVVQFLDSNVSRVAVKDRKDILYGIVVIADCLYEFHKEAAFIGVRVDVGSALGRDRYAVAVPYGRERDLSQTRVSVGKEVQQFAALDILSTQQVTEGGGKVIEAYGTLLIAEFQLSFTYIIDDVFFESLMIHVDTSV